MAACITSIPAFSQVSNPIPAVIEKSGLDIQLEEFATIPASSGGAPSTRINHMKPVKDGSGRLFVNDLRGKLHVIQNGSVSTYLDLKAEKADFRDSPGLGSGFTSFDFDPEFSTTGKFYTSHSEAAGSGTSDFDIPGDLTMALQGVILEWTASNPAAATFAGTSREVLRIDLDGTIHGMQEISFNPSANSGSSDYRKLYICLGDTGASIAGNEEVTHRLDSPYGSIMRIDPFGTNGRNGKYGIPADNPWATDGKPETLDELWAYGFRNPHRISWDPVSGKMLSGDIGERNAEEINLIEPGRDYGWNVREGNFLISWPGAGDDVFPLPANDASFNFTYPVTQYDHDEGQAVVGGYVYRGSAVPSLAGQYIFGDIASGKLFHAPVDMLTQGSQVAPEELTIKSGRFVITLPQLTRQSRADLRFGYDLDGELYALTKRDGKIRKIIPPMGPPPVEPTGEGKLSNISTRGFAGTGDQVMTGGFVIVDDQRRVMIRGVGPTLGGFGVAGTLADPILTLRKGGEAATLYSNDNWSDAANKDEITAVAARLGAFALEVGSKDAVILESLPKGSYTVQVSGAAAGTGVALIEVYRLDNGQ